MKLAVYAIVCVETKRCYIGGTIDVSHRWAVHRHLLRHGRHPNRDLQRDWNEYGAAQFEFVILEEVAGVERLSGCEQFHIDHCLMALYNVSPTAGSQTGFKFSKASRLKMSKSHIGKVFGPISDERRANISASLMGKKRSVESRRNQSMAWQRKRANELALRISAAGVI